MRLRSVIKLLLLGLVALLIVIGGYEYITRDKQVSTLGNSSEKYPNKPITMIVPYSAGGGQDAMVRAIEKVAVKYLGQPLVITNIPGGGATIGWNELAGAKPDGYTLGSIACGTLLQPLYGPTRYHYPTALEPLVQVMSVPIIAVVRSDQPWNDIADMVEYAKEHPGEIKFGHSGLGTAPHVTGEMFAKDAGINIIQVPFLGSADSTAALLGGHIQLVFTSPNIILEYMKIGKVKVLAVASEQRLTEPEFKDIPTFKEQGFNVIFTSWYGIGAPKGLPKDVKSKLDERFNQMLNDPEFINNMEQMGMTVEYLGTEEFEKKWISEMVRLPKIIKETGIAERIAAQKN